MKHIDIDEIPCQNRQGYGSLRQFFAGSAESEDETRFPRSVPVTLHFRERDRFSCDLQLCGTNRVEGVSDRIQQSQERHTLVSTPHQHDGGRAQGCARQVDAFLSTCASNVYETSRRGVLNALGNRSDNRPCALSSQVVDNNIDSLSELLDHCLFISLASQGMKRAE